MSSEGAAVSAGVPQAIGTRWFRKAGGMPPAIFGRSAKPLSGRYLSLTEREELAILHAQGAGVREIGRQMGRSASTISRELRRNAATRSGGLDYRATTAQWHADRSARRPKPVKLAVNLALRVYVQDRLAGVIVTPKGAVIAGPSVSWKGRRHGPRQDRRWASAWSPEQIAHRLRLDFPNDEMMRISHEAIYQSLYIQGRGALRRELTACLRTGRALRVPRARTRGRGKAFIAPEIMISERPAEVGDRAVPGHWEGDLILGLDSSAIGTLVERTTRFTLLLHLPRMAEHGVGAREKNGPALAGHGAEAVRDSITRTVTSLPEQLRRSLTWDQGAEMSQHARLKIDTGLDVYFCDPHSPWQRGTNENTNGLLRQYFPKGTDLSAHTTDALEAVALALNTRPRKTLGWRTPAEAFDEHLRLVQSTVATTG
jgi:IS30 family transposase